MQSHFVSLFLQYARLDRKRTLEGLSTDEAARLAELEATISRALLPHVPRGAERRNSIRVPAELACRWAPVACEEEVRITTISRTGAFIRTARPAPIGATIAITIELPDGGRIEIPACVANQTLSADRERRGMGVRFGRLDPAAMATIDDLYERSIIRAFGGPDVHLEPARPASEELTSG